MIRAFIESFLGPVGIRVLDFYETNSLIINGMVVLYGLLIVLSWTNLVSIRKRLVGAIAAQIVQSPSLHARSKVRRVLSEVNIPWEKAVEDVRFPFVAQQSAFWPRRKTAEAVQALLPAEDLAQRALDILAEAETKASAA